MRTSDQDSSQRMLNALLPETVVPIHCHPNSSENVICLCGRLEEVFYSVSPEPSELTKGQNFEVKEIGRYLICPREGVHGCKIPAGMWHTVEVKEPSVIYEAKDGKYKEDGSMYLEDFF